MYTENDLRLVLRERADERPTLLPPQASDMLHDPNESRGRYSWLVIAAISLTIVAVGAGVVVVRAREGGGHAAGPNTSAAASAPRVPAGAIMVALDLTQRVVRAGGTLDAALVITNTTHSPIDILGCPKTWLSVGLANSQIPFQPVGSLEQCPPYSLAAGSTRFAVKVLASYQFFPDPCTSQSTACHVVPPPLPPGDYVTRVYTQGLPAGTPAPSPVQVVVTG